MSIRVLTIDTQDDAPAEIRFLKTKYSIYQGIKNRYNPVFSEQKYYTINFRRLAQPDRQCQINLGSVKSLPSFTETIHALKVVLRS